MSAMAISLPGKDYVAGQPVELGHQNRALFRPPSGQRCRQLGPPVAGVGAPTGFGFDELSGDGEAFCLREPDDKAPCRHHPKAAL